MGKPLCTAERFRELFTTLGGAGTAAVLGCTERAVYRRREKIEEKTGDPMDPPSQSRRKVPGRVDASVENATIIIFSDAHYWPVEFCPVPVMHKALLYMCRKLKPDYVIANGDIVDFVEMSRFPRAGWEERPTTSDELLVCQQRMEEIRQSSPDSEHRWLIGNHCIRYDSTFSSRLPEAERVKGSRLSDHFPHWPMSVSLWFMSDNDVPLIVKHRIHGGMHALRRNVEKTRRHTATGHRHSADVQPVSAYDDTLWGLDSGCIADCFGPQFMYVEEGFRDWRSAFAVVTYQNGRLMKPDLCLKVDDEHFEFHREIIKV